MARFAASFAGAAIAASAMQLVAAQATGYTVYSSVVYARTGERTPMLSGDALRLTSYGANQMYLLVSGSRRAIGSIVSG
jgi:hypothetical protein